MTFFARITHLRGGAIRRDMSLMGSVNIFGIAVAAHTVNRFDLSGVRYLRSIQPRMAVRASKLTVGCGFQNRFADINRFACAGGEAFVAVAHLTFGIVCHCS